MPSFDDVFKPENIKEEYKKRAEIAKNEIVGAYAGIPAAIVDTSKTTGKNILDLSAYLANIGSKVVSGPANFVSGAVESLNTYINSSLRELATGIPTSASFYLRQGLNFLDSTTDKMGRKLPYPNVVVNQEPEKEYNYDPLTGQLMRPVNNVIEQGKELIRQYDVTGGSLYNKLFNSSVVDKDNKYGGISFIIKPYSYSELKKKSTSQIFTPSGKTLNAERLGNVNWFDVINYYAREGDHYYSCTLRPAGAFAPKFYHKDLRDPKDSTTLNWLPLVNPPSIKYRDITTKDSVSTSSNTLYYSTQMKKVEQIDLEFVENAQMDIIKYLSNYRTAMFPTDNTYVTRPIKDIYSIFDYFVYAPLLYSEAIANGRNDLNARKVIYSFSFAVIPTFIEDYSVNKDFKNHSISLIVLGESKVRNLYK